uniref:Uncharacterized protein n=1 Tax=Lotus japonicus TaxID=34305 RepID=I3T3Q8_LOTJA|nr:unknown [Lotus japonicus]
MACTAAPNTFSNASPFNPRPKAMYSSRYWQSFLIPSEYSSIVSLNLAGFFGHRFGFLT